MSLLGLSTLNLISEITELDLQQANKLFHYLKVEVTISKCKLCRGNIHEWKSFIVVYKHCASVDFGICIFCKMLSEWNKLSLQKSKFLLCLIGHNVVQVGN